MLLAARQGDGPATPPEFSIRFVSYHIAKRRAITYSAVRPARRTPGSPLHWRCPRVPVSSRIPTGEDKPCGRPRCLEARSAILAATLELVSEQGLCSLTMEAIARRAGVGKQTSIAGRATPAGNHKEGHFGSH